MSLRGGCGASDVAIAKSLNTKMSLRTERSGVSQSHHNEITTSKTSFSPRNDKKAFTLAEVLITLGVIGVVAAMTLPTLIQNYQKQVWVNQLKRSVSIVENGLKLTMSEDGVDSLFNTRMLSFYGTELNSNERGDLFISEINKYFKTVKNEKGIELEYKGLNGDDVTISGDNFVVSYLNDGTILVWLLERERSGERYCDSIKQRGGTLCSSPIADFYIDVNGAKGPNKFGRDLFTFIIGDNGKLYPWAGKDVALFFNQGSSTWENDYWKNNGSCKENELGFGCAARIIENGWKMDY